VPCVFGVQSSEDILTSCNAFLGQSMLSKKYVGLNGRELAELSVHPDKCYYVVNLI